MHHENFVRHAVELVPSICELVQVVEIGLRVRVLVLRADAVIYIKVFSLGDFENYIISGVS